MDSDPDAARALAESDAVRRELGRLGADDASAPDVPAHVTARVGAALRNATPRRRTGRRVAFGVGILVACATILGVAGQTRSPVTPAFPLPDTQLRAALNLPPELGPLAAPELMRACLAGLGYGPTQDVLGARPLQVAGRPAVLLLLPAESAQFRAVVVDATCTAAAPGVLADRTVKRR
jgi:hypothetical protein